MFVYRFKVGFPFCIYIIVDSRHNLRGHSVLVTFA
jgi:hypothetical protein